MRSPGRNFLCALLAALILLVGFGAFWLGLVPQRWNPLSPVSLDEPDAWFIDFRLAALRRDAAMCQVVLREPHIKATPIADSGIKKGCGWVNAVYISHVGDIDMSVGKLTCEASAALALWVEHEVQPVATDMFGSRVASIQHLGTYACRNIVGNPKWSKWRSQHALANAIDIASFRLENGTQISVAQDWRGSGHKARFLRAVHNGACLYFRVAIGPDFNSAHWNHFHYDRGVLRTCK
ncbi:MAG: extensin family protein [Hyphomicrobium sp.]